MRLWGPVKLMPALDIGDEQDVWCLVPLFVPCLLPHGQGVDGRRMWDGVAGAVAPALFPS